MKSLIIALCLLFCSTMVHAVEQMDLVLYLEHTGKNITCEWDDTNNNIADYEVRLYSFERKTYVALGRTELNTITFQMMKSGHYIAEIRACYKDDPSCIDGCPPDDPDCVECCSEWVQSSDPAYAAVDGVARGWWLYGYLAPPGPIGIH